MTMVRFFLIIIAVFFVMSGHYHAANAKTLISDISDHLIKINTRFKGTDILLFGARNDAGDIIVVVRGPKHGYIVRQKERVAGIWVNTKQIQFNNVDSFYAIASSRPLSAIRNEELLTSLQLGVNNIPFVPADETVKISISDFKDALLNDKLAKKLFGRYRQDLPFIGEVLFKVTLRFPENIPRGTYTAETYLINNGQLMAMQSTPIIVKKIGADAFISGAARKYPALYGLTAIAVALLAGWLAGVIFRKI